MAISVLVGACSQQAAPTPSGAAATSTPVDPRLTTLTIGVVQEPQTFDPHVNVAAVSAYRFYPNIYETLVQYAPDGTIKPMLADSWTISGDGLTYRFKLHAGVKFSDGTSFNAEAVRAGLERLRTINKGGVALFAPIGAVNPIDDLTVDIVLKQPYAPILAVLAGWQGAIFVSPAAVKANDAGGTDLAQKWLNEHTAGTGPFMLESWRPNDRIVLVRNPYYRESVARDAIQRVVEPLVVEPATMRQQIAAGDLDIAEELSPSIVEPLRSASGVQVQVTFAVGTPFGQDLFLNLQKKPLDDVNLRRAIAYAIDYRRLVTVWNGIASPAQGPFPDAFQPWFSSADSTQYTQDLAKAQDALRQGGHSFPLNPRLKLVGMWQAGQTGQRDMLQLIKEDLAKIGVDVEVTSAELPVYREAIWTHTFDMAFINAPLRYADPDSFFSLFVHSSTYGRSGFNPGITEKRVDDLIESARASTDLAQRRSMYNQLQRILTSEVLIVFTVNKQQAWAHRSNVAVQWNPMYGLHFRAHDIKKTPPR